MSTTATTQSGTTVQIPEIQFQQMSVPADYVFIAVLFLSIGIWLGAKLTRDGASARSDLVPRHP